MDPVTYNHHTRDGFTTLKSQRPDEILWRHGRTDFNRTVRGKFYVNCLYKHIRSYNVRN